MTINETIANIKALVYIATSDDALTQNETQYFTDIGIEAGLSETEVNEIVRDVVEGNETIEDIVVGIVSDEAKSRLISSLLKLCYADDDYSLAEKSGMIDICILLDYNLEELKKLEKKAEASYNLVVVESKLKHAGTNAWGKLSKAFDSGKKGATQIGKKITDGSADVARSVASGIGLVGSKISFSIDNSKKVKEENKKLREKLQKDTVTEAVKQKVIVQLYSKIQALAAQLKEEKKRNEHNEEMIRLLQSQIADFEVTMEVAQNAKTA